MDLKTSWYLLCIRSGIPVMSKVEVYAWLYLCANRQYSTNNQPTAQNNPWKNQYKEISKDIKISIKKYQKIWGPSSKKKKIGKVKIRTHYYFTQTLCSLPLWYTKLYQPISQKLHTISDICIIYTPFSIMEWHVWLIGTTYKSILKTYIIPFS